MNDINRNPIACQYPQVNYIPPELKALRQWVAWKYETKEGIKKKVPYGEQRGIEGKLLAFDEAVDRYNQHAGLWDGIGFVFDETDPFTGIDLDKILDANNGIVPSAVELLEKFSSYTEVSPSGRGLHIIVKGSIPESIRKDGLEVYSSKRYFTVTGNRWDKYPATIEDRQKELTELYNRIKPPNTGGSIPTVSPMSSAGSGRTNDEVINILRKEYPLLWSGDLDEQGNDHSRADQSLCYYLSVLTGQHPQQMDAVFRQSGLMRDKWDVVHYADRRTYGQVTIQKAIDYDIEQNGAYDGPYCRFDVGGYFVLTWPGGGVTRKLNSELSISTARQAQQQPDSPLTPLSSYTMEPIYWLWENCIPIGKVTLIAGNPGLGKSLITVSLAAAVTTGGKLPDGTNAPLGDVIMLSDEDDCNDTILPRVVKAGGDPGRIYMFNADSLKKDLEKLEKALKNETRQYKLVTIDALNAYLDGVKSHEQAEMRNLLKRVREFASRNHVAVVLITHLNKGEGSALQRVSGSGAVTAAPRGVWGITKDKEGDPGRRLMLPIKMNNAPDDTGFAYRIRIVELNIKGKVCKIGVLEWEPEPITGVNVNKEISDTLRGDSTDYGKLNSYRLGILRYLGETKNEDGWVSKTELRNVLFNKHVDKKVFNQALNELVEEEEIDSKTEPRKSGIGKVQLYRIPLSS